jgi:hypothetical protein
MSPLWRLGLGATLGIALSLSLLPTSGHAYTQEEQQACQPDAFRLAAPKYLTLIASPLA